MKLIELYKLALAKYKKHKLNSWIIAIICALFIGSICLISILSDFLVLLLIPVIILPFFFACVMSHVALAERDELSFRSLFGFFALFFRQPFNSSFSFIRSLLKGLIIFIISGFIVSGICYAVYARSETFVITINQIIEQLKDASLTQEQFQSYLEANNNELNNFLGLTNGISFLIFAYAYIFFTLREEITIFIRIKLRGIPLAGQIARAAIKLNSRKFNRYYFMLNWPLLLLILLGMIGGVVLSTVVFNKFDMVGGIGLAVSIAASAFFLPFYFANQEVIFEQLSIDINASTEEYVKGVFEKYGNPKPTKQNDEVEGVKKDPDDTES